MTSQDRVNGGRLATRAKLAEEIALFAKSVEPANARWEYAYRAGSYVYSDKYGRRVCYNTKSFATIARFVGGHLAPSSVGYRLSKLTEHGSVDAARAAYHALPHHEGFPDPYAVGPVEPWQVGHVYFARVVGFPHVVKIGFSRRIRDRIEDIESKYHVRLDVFATKVGTMADEQWWHRDWRNHVIEGEWFFDPRATGRSVPQFLASATMVAA